MNAHREGLFREWLPTNEREAWRLAHAFILCDDPQVKVTAVKHAHDGDGVIVRLTRRVFTSESVSISCFGRRIGTAWLADAREQNCAPLPVEGGSVQVPMRYSVSTIRVRFAE
jgi:alpha-mannosidase